MVMISQGASVWLALFCLATVHGEGWRQLAPLPDPLGVACPFAGVTGGGLLVAGGAHFPDRPPWEGGKKVWTDRVWWLDQPGGNWKKVGCLAKGLGYGVSVSHRGWVVCAGGSDRERHHAECFRLKMDDGKLIRENLPELPQPVANGCGALWGDTLYVVGGQAKPDGPALRSVYALDLAKPGSAWRELPLVPGRPRMLAMAGATESLLVVAGGVDLDTAAAGGPRRVYLSDVWGYQNDSGWKRLADLPKPLAAAPSGLFFRLGRLWLLGGDDGSQVGADPRQHRGFDRGLLRYNPDLNLWEKTGALPVARVTVPTVVWRDLWVIPSGEMRPGVRSPEVWAIDPTELDPFRKK
jgi:N-acetylneuraminic acid mutarotase